MSEYFGPVARTSTTSDVFNAIGDAHRREVLDTLISGEKAVGAIVDDLSMSQPQVSKHLRVLSWGCLNGYAGPCTGTAGLTELNATTGRRIRVLTAPSYGFSNPVAMALVGGDLVVGNSGNASLIEINPTTGGLVRIVDATQYIAGTAAFLATPGGLWVAGCSPADTVVCLGQSADSLIELDPATGSVIHQVSASDHLLYSPDALAAVGGQLWVADTFRQAVTALEP
jgi:DNA-binding transcriptional ArsR family regulator